MKNDFGFQIFRVFTCTLELFCPWRLDALPSLPPSTMLPSLLPFERLPVTILVLGCYLAAIISTLVIQERLPAARRHQRELGLNLDEAWKDLQKVNGLFLESFSVVTDPFFSLQDCTNCPSFQYAYQWQSTFIHSWEVEEECPKLQSLCGNWRLFSHERHILSVTRLGSIYGKPQHHN